MGCGRCEAVCPAAALRVEVGDVAGDEIEIRRFELEPGRCMGCGLCRRACPEEALMMAEGGSRVEVGSAPVRLRDRP
ncbi:MAG: 4Fe-4S dicluster domain-containing protein, partial [Deltaproteobacteria bacterium]|nr:4Fe-4S dicluster domain-containing protein [Deltaproteobacteria bacterium]